MKKVNFNAAQSFEVPESWIENAVNAKPEKKPVYLRPYVIGSAASVVLAVAVTIFAVVAMNKAPIKPQSLIPVKPQTTTSATVEPTAAPTSAATQPQTKAPVATQPVTQPVTEVVTQPVTEPVTEAVTEAPTEFPVVGEDERMLSDEWIISNVEGVAMSDGARINGAILKMDELYTGSVTVRTAKDSPFGADDVLRCTVTAKFTALNDRTDGIVALKLSDNGNGEKSVTFCPYKSGAYLPSGYAYTFTFTGKTEDGKEITKTVTQTLSGKSPVTITI